MAESELRPFDHFGRRRLEAPSELQLRPRTSPLVCARVSPPRWTPYLSACSSRQALVLAVNGKEKKKKMTLEEHSTEEVQEAVRFLEELRKDPEKYNRWLDN